MVPSVVFGLVKETRNGYSVRVTFTVRGHGWSDETWAEAEVSSSPEPYYNEDIKRLYALAIQKLGDQLSKLYSPESFGRKGT